MSKLPDRLVKAGRNAVKVKLTKFTVLESHLVRDAIAATEEEAELFNTIHEARAKLLATWNKNESASEKFR